MNSLTELRLSFRLVVVILLVLLLHCFLEDQVLQCVQCSQFLLVA